MKSVIFLSFIIFQILSTKALSESRVTINKIPGTCLYTGLFYTIRMDRHPTGWITWTDQRVDNQDGNYVQIDMNPNNLHFYEVDQKWEKDVQWYFEPTLTDGYYNLKNRAVSNAIVTVRQEYSPEDINYVILAKLFDHGLRLDESLENKTLIKPVKVTGKNRTYQLKFRSHPQGTVTWTERKHGEYSHYIQVEQNKNPYSSRQWDDINTYFEFAPTSESQTILDSQIASKGSFVSTNLLCWVLSFLIVVFLLN